MFGNKKVKQERLSHLMAYLEENDEATQAELARYLKVPRSTVHKDLTCLEDTGVLLAEDNNGRLSLFGRRSRR
ncbi:MAG: HTH domain-containing protein [Chloroflexi bacterium]|nr:HTH domain-containing protein [Chloroflexota bacterium]MBP8059969.1 HTH domain-containing protein [Chloroflexota bacterium]